MYAAISDAVTYLSAQSLASLLALFWFTVIFEFPRYTIAFVSAAVSRLQSAWWLKPARTADVGRVTVVIAGHSEADSIECCVRAMHEQSRPPDEIVVVSDGSTDNMPEVLGNLLRRGLIDQAHCTDLRAGKSAAVNLSMRWATGDVIVNIDCDCSFDRHALKHILAPFSDPRAAASSGNILVRNEKAGLVPAFQAVEYLISISLGKQASMLIDQVVCASGAFSAFRTSALRSVNGLDVGGGEDLDLTLKLRKAGWKIYFADAAICYTDVPDTLRALTNQRLRWERDAVRMRYRKHADMMNPFSPKFRLSELLHEIEFLFFQILGAAVLPLYVLWLFVTYGEFGLIVMLAAQFGLLLVDVAVFAVAALCTPKAQALSLLPYVPGYSLFNGLYMRFVRLFAYTQEWIFNASTGDNYVPEKVRLLRKW